MAGDVLLSIAIPTYNRGSCLGFLLESICSQVGEVQSCKIEVLVFDNCSTDDTKAVVERFLPNNSYLKYTRNEQDIGADKNFTKAFFSARGKYLWIICDDDLLFDGAIPWVVDFCGRSEFGCAYLYSVPETLSRVHELLHRKTTGLIRCRSYEPYAFAQAANYRLTFLSGSVVNRQEILNFKPTLVKDIERFSGSNLVHLTWIFASVLSRPRSYIVTTPLFAATVANSGPYNPVGVFSASLSELFGYYFSGLSAGAKPFIQWFTLIGWFPKVVFDWRFRDKYKSSGYSFAKEDFPAEMRHGFAWQLFDRFVLNGSMFSAGIAVLLLKTWHRMMQIAYLARGSR